MAVLKGGRAAMSWMALTIGSRQWPAFTQNRPDVASMTLLPSGLK
jgi:hypothetical protein